MDSFRKSMHSYRIMITNPDSKKVRFVPSWSTIRYESRIHLVSWITSPDLWSTIQTESGFVVHEPKQIYKSQDLWSTFLNKSMDLQDMIPRYNSCNLTILTLILANTEFKPVDTKMFELVLTVSVRLILHANWRAIINLLVLVHLKVS
jgi:hypothetical protein